jgi:hypothetical protein
MSSRGGNSRSDYQPNTSVSSAKANQGMPGGAIEAVVMLDGPHTEPPPGSKMAAGSSHDSSHEVVICGDITAIQDQSTTGTPMTHDHPADPTDELRQQLEGKNELIAALVAELEQVVEQLDRVKRNGSDRPRTSAMSTALPSEVVEEHQQVLGDMQRVVQQWEEMQAAGALRRIESEIIELRTLLANGSDRIPAADSRRRSGEAAGGNLDTVLSRLSIGASEGSDRETSTAGSDWAAMKRQMLGESSHEPAEEDVCDDLATLLDGIAAPEPVDLDAATVDVLKRACEDRDTYIVQITRWVRQRRAVTVPENWEEIAGVPEELQRRVEQLASRLEEQVRLAEVEMSLERARLSREKSQLQSDRAVMERHLKRLGITSLDELEDIAINSTTSSGDRRWMRFLGVNRKS